MIRYFSLLIVFLLSIPLTSQPLLIDINPGGQSSYPEYFTEYKGQVYFRAYNPTSNRDVLFKTDGTLSGTQMVKDVALSLSYPKTQLSKVNGLLIFSGYEAATGWELWVSDGTTSGTYLLKDIITGSNSSSPQYITEADNLVYFQVHNASGDLELWKSDGTTSGTNKITDIEPAISNKPPNFCFCNGLLYFISDHPATGQELWKSDGTAGGTQLVTDLMPGPESGLYETADITCYQNKVYFAGNTGGGAEEVFVSDGTAAGTHILKDINEAQSAHPAGFTEVDGKLYFTASHARFGRELFITDGTESGTAIVKDVYPGGYDGLEVYYPEKLANDGMKLFFAGYEPEHGEELWSSMGSPGTTRLLADVDTSRTSFTAVSSKPRNITPAGSFICFTANEFPFATSAEFCVMDKQGLNQSFYDLRSPGSSFPLHLVSAMGKVFFSADDSVNGRELWVFGPNEYAISGFTLVDAVTDQDIGQIEDNDVINLATLPNEKINIRADVSSTSSIGSVVFELDGNIIRTENVAPYAVAGDNPTGDYHKWKPQPGNYKLTATPYSGPNGTGESGVPACISFIIADVSFGISHFTLIHTDTKEEIYNILARPWPQSHLGYQSILPQKIGLNGITDPHKISIVAKTVPPTLDYVDFFDFDIEYSRKEMVAPYSLFGDKNGVFKEWNVPQAGEICRPHYLAAEAVLGNQNAKTDAYFELEYSDIAVTGISLYNAENDDYIMNVNQGDILDLANLPTRRINFVANTVPEEIGSVIFSVGGSAIDFNTCCDFTNNENIAPYALFGDRSGDLNEWTAKTGSVHILAYPSTVRQLYTNIERYGAVGSVLNIGFNIIDSSPNTKRSLSDDGTEPLSIFPNPGNGLFHLEIMHDKDEATVLRVHTIEGRIVHEDRIVLNPGINEISLDLESLDAGVYLLETTIGERRKLNKLIVK